VGDSVDGWLDEILARAGFRICSLLVVCVPLQMGLAVHAGESLPGRAAIFLAAAEAIFVSILLFLRSPVGKRQPRLGLTALTVATITMFIFAPFHSVVPGNPYAILGAVTPLGLAAFAPVSPIVMLALGVLAASEYSIALQLWPGTEGLSGVTFSGLSLVVATTAAVAVRGQRALWNELSQARDRALEATRSKSEFLANMSHELRTPMTAILGFAEELELAYERRDESFSPEVAFATIRRNGEHLLALVNDNLDLSKIEAGRLEVVQESCSPARIIGEVAGLLGPRAREKGLAFEARATGPVPKRIYSDSMRLRQIAINLVGNAIKFTTRGYVRLEIGLERSDSGGDSQLVIAVRDSGPGFSAQDRERVFEAYTQLDRSASRQAKGTGLGLTLSRRLATLLGGEILAESAPGQGSTFRLRLPIPERDTRELLAPAELADFAVVERERPISQATRLAGRVLVVDDGVDNRRLISTVLRRTGLEVELADDGAAGCERALAAAAEGEPFDLVLMDMQMPVLDGYAATERLRAAGYSGPVLALTAEVLTGARERCLAAGCDDYVTKPIARAELFRCLERWLGSEAKQRG
jgi:signal transduction histidine kinase/CheY-like chemotaxis protein